MLFTLTPGLMAKAKFMAMKASCWIFIVAIFNIIVVVSLYSISNIKNHHKNGFNRSFIENPLLIQAKVLDVKFNTMYISGLTNSNIYISNHLLPDSLFYTNYSLDQIRNIQLNFPENEQIAWGALKLTVDSPYIYAYEGITPIILHATVSKPEFTKSKYAGFKFDKGFPLNEKSFLGRSFNIALNQNVIMKSVNGARCENSFRLDKQGEGIFSTDGAFIYNYQLKRIIYVYYYRNIFNCLDTMLNKEYTGHTIDTTFYSNLKIAQIKSERTQKLVGNLSKVNKRACTYKQKLYINSALKADNELLPAFNNYSVIDVYDLKQKRYMHSFYLNSYNNMKLKEFRVYENKIVALFGKNLVCYNLP